MTTQSSHDLSRSEFRWSTDQGQGKIWLNVDSDKVILEAGEFYPNEWQESFDTLPLALMRLAALVQCSILEQHSFTHDTDVFAINAATFLAGETS